MIAATVIRDVFRQARASGLTAALLSFTLIAAVVCTAWNFDRIETEPIAGLSGATLSRPVVDPEAVARFQFVLAGIIADTAGVLLALVWTAGFLPSFLEPGAVSVLLAKPVSRSRLFLWRWFGVVAYVGAFAVLFVAATWTAIGLNTGLWPVRYWLVVPLMISHFVAFYGFSALLAVATRSATVCMVGSLAFWLICWGMNYGRHAVAGIRVQEATEHFGRLIEWCYWIMPKPADFSLLLIDAFQAGQIATPGVAFQAVQSAGLFHPWPAVLTSVSAGAVFLLLAAYEFVHDEY